MFKSIFKDYDAPHKDARFSIKDEESILEKPISREEALHNQILPLWKEVWQGLYRYGDGRRNSYNDRGSSHINRLTKLYLAAGMSAAHIIKSSKDSSERLDNTSGILGLLSLALAQEGPRDLRLYDKLSISSLESVIAHLEVYKSLLPAMDKIYKTLRSLEVGFRVPTVEDEKAVELRFRPLAVALARQLLHLDARLALLILNLGDENRENLGDSGDFKQHLGWLVRDRVFPPDPRGKKSFGSGMS
jgi:hypothetical protein